MSEQQAAWSSKDIAEERRAVLQMLYEAHHREPCGSTLAAISAAIQHLQAVDDAAAGQ
jgi:aspartyl aminopeptidase